MHTRSFTDCNRDSTLSLLLPLTLFSLSSTNFIFSRCLPFEALFLLSSDKYNDQTGTHSLYLQKGICYSDLDCVLPGNNIKFRFSIFQFWMMTKHPILTNRGMTGLGPVWLWQIWLKSTQSDKWLATKESMWCR